MNRLNSVSLRRGLFVLWGCGIGLSACTEDTPGTDGGGTDLATGGARSTGGGASTGGGISQLGGSGPGDTPGQTGGASLDGERLEVEGGTFPMGRGDAGGDACPADQACAPGEGPEHTATVSRFWLDRFEVTVDRFRAFYEHYPPSVPVAGAGAHPAIAGSGWQADFALDLPSSQGDLLEALACDEDATFSPSIGTRDAFPVNCVSWPLAFLFCTESGGRLPTEAEWEFAAAGGDEDRSYPWGNEAPDSSHASFFPSELEPVGTHPSGRGRFGQEDLAGGVWEWALDWLDTHWYSDGGATCTDCARVSSGTHRVLRGGAYGYDAVALRAAARSGDVPSSHQPSIGFRCAYDTSE